MSQLKVNSIIPVGGVPTGGGGGIVQTIQYNTNTQASTTGNTFVASGLSGSITTVNTNSKIIVFVAQNFYISSSSNNTGGGINVNRVISGTETVLDDGPRSSTGPYGLWMGQDSGATTSFYSRYNIQYLDSPNQAAGTTITYNTKIASYSSSYTIVAQVGNTQLNDGTSYLTLMEVSV